jgi:hypothetical protein
VLRIASSTAIFPGPMRSPLARSRRMQRRVSVMVPNPTLDEGMFYKFTYGLGTGKSVRLCPFIHNGNKRRRDAKDRRRPGGPSGGVSGLAPWGLAFRCPLCEALKDACASRWGFARALYLINCVAFVKVHSGIHSGGRAIVAVNSVHLPPTRTPSRSGFANVLIQNDKATDKSQG